MREIIEKNTNIIKSKELEIIEGKEIILELDNEKLPKANKEEKTKKRAKQKKSGLKENIEEQREH